MEACQFFTKKPKSSFRKMTPICYQNNELNSFRSDTNYANLLEAANFEEREAVLRPLFERMETYDFEIIMKQLESAEAVLDVYKSDIQTLQQIRNDKTIPESVA